MYVFSVRDDNPPSDDSCVFGLLTASSFKEAATIVAASPRCRKRHHNQLVLQFSCHESVGRGFFWMKLRSGERITEHRGEVLFTQYVRLRGAKHL